jgi:DNA polymerase I-like protein with 3'-5' exonuclease and polymerase domains
VIPLQGPKESAAEAQDIVKKLMERPLLRPLLVDLTVDIKSADTWYEAK